VAHGVGHGAECPDGRRLHDQGDHAEHQVGDLVAPAIRVALPEGGQRQPHQDRQQQNLQDIALREGPHERPGDDVHQEVDGAQMLCPWTA
jgi:hypothetical protein